MSCHIGTLPRFYGLQPNIADVMTSEMCFKHNHLRKYDCMDDLNIQLLQGWSGGYMGFRPLGPCCFWPPGKAYKQLTGHLITGQTL